MAIPETDDRTVVVTPPKPEPVAKAPTTPAPEPTLAPAPAPPDFETQYRERLRTDLGVEDPTEVQAWRQRAQQADVLERQLSQRPAPPQGPQRPQPQIDWAQWEAFARINPGQAFLQMRQYEQAQRQQEQLQQAAFVESRIRSAQEFAAAESQAERYVRDEFPEAYNKASKLHKEGQAVYTSMPWLHNMGNGFELATKIAAANLGLAPKSKRTSTVTDEEVRDQAPERGTKRPPAESVDDGKPLTPRQKKMAKDMGVSEKDYRMFQKARATGKNVSVK